MRHKKETIYLCQFSESKLNVVKCCLRGRLKTEFLALESASFTAGTDDQGRAEGLSGILKKLAYRNNPVIISLSRQSATLRVLQIPAQAPEEIERIIALQASRYLPYSSDELITAYQLIERDSRGFSLINMVTAHKEIIQRYLKIMQLAGVTQCAVVLSSWGLYSLYRYLNPKNKEAVFVIDLDFPQAEIAIVSNKRLYFSRFFKITQEQGWQELVKEELRRTKDACVKEIPEIRLEKVFLFGPAKAAIELKEVLAQDKALSVELLDYEGKVSGLPSGLLGMGVSEVPESLYLLPPEVKEKQRKTKILRQGLKMAFLAMGIILVLGLALAQNIKNKADYLKRLKAKVSNIEKEAIPLLGIDKKLKLLERHSGKEVSSLDILHSLYELIPADSSLLSFAYEEAGVAALRGQAQELNSVFLFASRLTASPVFKNFTVKVKYATKRKTLNVEFIDFQIDCLRKL